MTILEAVRCNMDIQFIGSGESAKAMIYYITDYITKSQLKAHVAYAALQLAVKKCEDVGGDDEDFIIRSKRLLQKCAYALISHQELSAQQVASYLLSHEDHFTSNNFSCLYWASFERFVERHDSVKLFGQQLSVEAEPKGDDEDGDVDGEAASDTTSEHEAEDDDGEEVSIRVGGDGNVTAVSDQVSDYIFRPEELQSMCLWDFVAKTEKSYSCKNIVAPEDLDQIEFDDGDGNVSPQPEQGPTVKYNFLPCHGEAGQKHLRLRSHDAVPVPIGPAMPRRDQEDARSQYCRLMLTLFRPWRDVADLRLLDESWESSFENFENQLLPCHVAVLRNMQILNECRDSRNNHMQTRVRTRARPKAKPRGEYGDAGNEIEDIDMSEVLDHLDDIDRMSSRKMEEANKETNRCLRELEDAGFFSVSPTTVATCDETRFFEQPEPADQGDNILEDEWRETYDNRKATWKLQATKSSDREVLPAAVINSVVALQEEQEQPPLVYESENEHAGELSNDGEALIHTVVEKWTLNKEQIRAFEIMSRHTLQEKPEQLLMYLGGPGGTGKSRVVNALREFFSLRNQSRRFRLAAYTGVAARNIGGATLHSLLQMNDSG